MTYERPENLPRYKSPPVSEVQLGLVLQPVHIPVTMLPALFELLEDDYPKRMELPQRPPELLNGNMRRSAFRLELGDIPPAPRIRFRDQANTRWLDLQSDMLTCGWRRTPDDEYPSYGDLRNEFERLLHLFEVFWSQVGTEEELYIVDTSVKYYNDFTVDAQSSMDAMQRAFGVDMEKVSIDGLPAPGTTGLFLRFPFSDGQDEPYALLTVQGRVSPHEQDFHALLNLSYRGDPFVKRYDEATEPLDAALSFLDNGHDHIVRAFTGVTSTELHSTWGRYQ